MVKYKQRTNVVRSVGGFHERSADRCVVAGRGALCQLNGLLKNINFFIMNEMSYCIEGIRV